MTWRARQAALLEKAQQVTVIECLASRSEANLARFAVEQLDHRGNLQRAGRDIRRDAK